MNRRTSEEAGKRRHRLMRSGRAAPRKGRMRIVRRPSRNSAAWSLNSAGLLFIDFNSKAFNIGVILNQRWLANDVVKDG